MQEKRNIKRIVYWVTIGILIAVIIACGSMIAYKFITDAQEQDFYDDVLHTMPTMDRPQIPTGATEATEPTEVTEPEATEPTEPEDSATPPPFHPESDILYGYRALYELNNDMVGFIEIPGTVIRYPVVQSPYQANYYLRRNFLKRSATCGTIYVREACDVNKPSDNITIYGHKMTNGTMFADLHKYKSKEFWDEHRYIHFDTLTEQHTYEIFAVFQTEVNRTDSFNYHLFDDADDAAEFDRFVNSCKLLSYYETDITPVYGDKLITLSTCDKSMEQGRLVVVARRIV
ncbi:MAG: class B sortase [Oscillospiraceae bacterium]|nr:class B sortase [Oscillospiraceae bacterium]